jgi:hypothetical protein
VIWESRARKKSAKVALMARLMLPVILPMFLGESVGPPILHQIVIPRVPFRVLSPAQVCPA